MQRLTMSRLACRMASSSTSFEVDLATATNVDAGKLKVVGKSPVIEEYKSQCIMHAQLLKPWHMRFFHGCALVIPATLAKVVSVC